MSDLDPDRFTLRQADAAREAYAQVMEELDFVKAQLARLPTRRDQAFTPLRIMLGTAVTTAALVILWFEAFWRHCLSGRTGPRRSANATSPITREIESGKTSECLGTNQQLELDSNWDLRDSSGHDLYFYR